MVMYETKYGLMPEKAKLDLVYVYISFTECGTYAFVFECTSVEILDNTYRQSRDTRTISNP